MQMNVKPAASPTVTFLLFILFMSAKSISIGFSQRSQTVSEADIKPEALSFDTILIHIHADRVAEKDYTFMLYFVEAGSTASVQPIISTITFELVPDAAFGVESNGIIQELRELSAGEIDDIGHAFFWNDYYAEDEECFTLQIFTETDNGTFSCNEDAVHTSDYFCLHTICIEDNDQEAPLKIGFEKEFYNVTEGERVKVCAGFIASEEIQNAIFSEVYIAIVPTTTKHQPLADRNRDYRFMFDIDVPLTNMARKRCVNVETNEDTVLEEVEFATLLVYIDAGSNATVTITTTSISIFDNNEASVGLEKNYYDSNEEICVVLEQVSRASFILEVMLTVHSEIMTLNSSNKGIITFEVGQTRACATVCSVVAVYSRFQISLSDLDSRVQLTPDRSTAEVNNTLEHDVGIAWEKSSYTARGLSNVTACVVVYSTLSIRDIDISVDIISDGGIGVFTRPSMSIMSELGERICVSVDVTETACKNFTLRVSSEDQYVCIPNDSTSVTIDTNTTRCALITVGYETREYQTPAVIESMVELCAVISTPSSGIALRPFMLHTTLQIGSRATFQVVGSGILEFKTNDTRQCYNIHIIIPADEMCDDFSMESINVAMTLLAGDGNIDVLPPTAVLSITDSTQPECAPIVVGYAGTTYTVSEGNGVIVCVEITSHPVDGAPRPFSLNLMTENGTADSGNDFMSFSVNISFEVGDQSHCEIILTFHDETCEFTDCSHEYFLSSLNTNDYRVILEPSETTIIIEDPVTQNCSETLADDSCMTALPSPLPANPNNSQLLYVYISVSLATGVLFVIIAIVLVILAISVCRRKKKMSVSLPKYRSIKAVFPRNIVMSPERKMMAEIQLKMPRQMMFSKDHINLSNIVGHGESGVVYKALLKTAGGKELVAVKTVKALFATSDVSKLIKEISIMLSFNHPNVMALSGVCLDQESPLLIMQFMSNGSVLEYVRRNKDNLMVADEADTVTVMYTHKISSTRKLMVGMCHQIAKGMHYLTEQRIVHRDLAARNCMIDMNGIIKVTDFGLTENIPASNYFRKDERNDEKVPIRWMAPESIDCDLYTEKTDVWSYGVTCWEVFTCGQIPYHGISVMSLFAALSRGERLDKPQNLVCTDEIFSTIRVCWHESPEQRPTFFNLVQQMSAFLEEEAGYVELCSSLNWRKLHVEQQKGVVETQVQSKNDYELQSKMKHSETHLCDTM